MSGLRRALGSALGRPGKTGILAALAALCTLLMMVTAYVTVLTQEYRETIVAQEGVFLSVEVTTEPYETVAAVPWTELPDLKSAQMSSGGVCFASQEGQEALEISIGYQRSLPAEGEIPLAQGSLPQDGALEVAVNASLAQDQGWSLGETLQLTDLEGNKTLPVTITGMLSPEAQLTQDLYASPRVMEEVLGDDSYYLLDLYPDAASHLDSLETAARELVETSGLTASVSSSLLGGAIGFSGVAEMLLDISDGLLWGTVLLSLWILSLVTLLWLRSHARDMGIYIALGAGKGQILGQLVLELTLVGAVVIACAGLVGMLLLNQTGRFLVLQLRNLLGYQFTSALQEMDAQLLQRALPPQTVLLVCALELGVLLLLTAGYGALLLRTRWRDLFERHS